MMSTYFRDEDLQICFEDITTRPSKMKNTKTESIRDAGEIPEKNKERPNEQRRKIPKMRKRGT
jgi:hypothetical protein